MGKTLGGGIVEGHPQQKRSGWLLYVRVEDVGPVLERAEELGGRALRLEGELQANGDVALIQDPGGAVIAVYRYTEPASDAEVAQ